MDPQFDYLDFSRWLTWMSVGLNVLTLGMSLSALAIRDRRWVRAARNALVLNGFVMVGAAAGLVAGFINGAYDVEYIYNYSERDLPLGFKICGLWGGLDGSILFWAMLLGALSAIVAFGFRRDESHPVGQRFEPHVYIVLGLVQLFFLSVITMVADPFNTFMENGHGDRFFQLFPDGIATDGAGLNPLLVNYWMQIHPPCLYVGWVMYTVPFAYGIASLLAGEQGSYWIRKVRRWMLVAWMFNTTGCILGGLWAYEVLGWGGYWAWDPVENASFLPWLLATAFLHSVMVQERRDMLKGWNAFLICATFVSSIFGTWLTRSGAVSSVHAFSEGPVGNWFFAFWLVLTWISFLLIGFRWSSFFSRNRVESYLSREAAFIINNMVLVALTVGVGLLTIWPIISHHWFHEQVSVGVPVYNQVTIPLFVLLLFLTAIGPGLGWIKTSTKALVRHFGWSTACAVPLAVAIQCTAGFLHGGEGGKIPVSDWIYPAGVLNFIGALIITTVTFELIRNGRVRAARRQESLLPAIFMVMVKNNRRYGGYMVHVGLGILAIAIVNSSIFQVKKEVRLDEGESIALGSYEMHLVSTETDFDYPVYEKTHLNIEIRKLTDERATVLKSWEPLDRLLGSESYRRSLSPEELAKDERDHAGFQAQLNALEKGALVGVLEPERRHYRKKDQTVREVDIHWQPWQDLYVYFADTESNRTYLLTFYRNPLVIGLIVGWLTMVFGGIWAGLPMGRRKVGLSD